MFPSLDMKQNSMYFHESIMSKSIDYNKSLLYSFRPLPNLFTVHLHSRALFAVHLHSLARPFLAVPHGANLREGCQSGERDDNVCWLLVVRGNGGKWAAHLLLFPLQVTYSAHKTLSFHGCCYQRRGFCSAFWTILDLKEEKAGAAALAGTVFFTAVALLLSKFFFCAGMSSCLWELGEVIRPLKFKKIRSGIGN